MRFLRPGQSLFFPHGTLRGLSFRLHQAYGPVSGLRAVISGPGTLPFSLPALGSELDGPTSPALAEAARGLVYLREAAGDLFEVGEVWCVQTEHQVLTLVVPAHARGVPAQARPLLAGVLAEVSGHPGTLGRETALVWAPGWDTVSAPQPPARAGLSSPSVAGGGGGGGAALRLQATASDAAVLERGQTELDAALGNGLSASHVNTASHLNTVVLTLARGPLGVRLSLCASRLWTQGPEVSRPAGEVAPGPVLSQGPLLLVCALNLDAAEWDLQEGERALLEGPVLAATTLNAPGPAQYQARRGPLIGRFALTSAALKLLSPVAGLPRHTSASLCLLSLPLSRLRAAELLSAPGEAPLLALQVVSPGFERASGLGDAVAAGPSQSAEPAWKLGAEARYAWPASQPWAWVYLRVPVPGVLLAELRATLAQASLVAGASLPASEQASRALSAGLRAQVWGRDGGRCVACGSRTQLEFDHVIPVSLGGASSEANLQLLCRPCNRSKGARMAQPAGKPVGNQDAELSA